MSKQIPNVEESTKFNFITSIWIVPIVALFIAAWLAYQYYAQLGVEIRIIFPENQGLKAGQSQIKYRDVSIGTVTRIELQENGEGVVVIARMDKTATPYLNGHSKFWIVKPEVGISGVSGLDTLISGTYIDMHTKKGGSLQKKFLGLEHTFRDTGGGEYYVLNTPRSDSSVRVGTPIYFKNVEVGQVEYVVLSLDDASIDIIIFVDKQYVPYVHTDSKFWIRSTVDIGLVNGKLDVTLAPAKDLIQGAIKFSTTGKDSTRTVADDFVFHLHKSRNVIESKKIGHGGKDIKRFMLLTQDPIAKLKVNALVRYDGFEVGKVKEINLNYAKKTHKMNGEILIEIDTSVFEDMNDVHSTGEENFYQAVKEGLRAQIVPADPITGSLYVDLNFDHNDANKSIVQGEGYALLPTIRNESTDIMSSVGKVVDKINNLELEKLLASLNSVIDKSAKPVEGANDLLVDLKKTVKNLNTLTEKKTFASMPDEVNKTLKELTRTLKATKKVVKGYDNDSLLVHQLAQTLKVVTQTSKEMQEFLKMLNRKPNSLIFGDK